MNRKGVNFCLATAFISGISIFINKFGVNNFNPYIFTFLKNSLVGLSLSLVIFLNLNHNFKCLKSKDWLNLIMIGLIGGSLPFLLFFKGLSLTNPASASFIHKTLFVWVGGLSVLFLKEKTNSLSLMAAVIFLFANFLILKNISFSASSGNVLVLVATFLWAIETILSKKALKNLPPLLVAWGRMFFGSLFLLLFIVISGNLKNFIALTGQDIGWLIITTGFLLAYVASWYQGLKYTSASLATTILLLGLPITTFLNLIWDKTFSLPQLTGSLLIILIVGAVLKLPNYVFKRN